MKSKILLRYTKLVKEISSISLSNCIAKRLVRTGIFLLLARRGMQFVLGNYQADKEAGHKWKLANLGTCLIGEKSTLSIATQ